MPNAYLSFKEGYRDLQELVREHSLLRANNRGIEQGDAQGALFLFSEAAIVLLILERFLRAILAESGVTAEILENANLSNLLEMATAKSRRLLRLPWDNQAEGIKQLCGVRNTLLHGNYEQAARKAECGSVAEYFATQFAAETEQLYRIVDGLFAQIDSATGKRIEEV